MLSTEPAQLLHYNPAFNFDFVERLLGRRKRDDLSRSTRNRLTVQQKRLHDIVSPQLIWKEFPVAGVDKRTVELANGTCLRSGKMAHSLREASSLIVFIATVGKFIDREIESLMKGGALAHGYVADALGSGAVENLADRFHLDMAKKVARQNQFVGLRFSPGYCDWPISEQQKLFSLLDNETIDVELDNTCLMAPRKSISGIFGLFNEKDASWDSSQHNPCRRCAKKDCIARRIDATPPSH